VGEGDPLLFDLALRRLAVDPLQYLLLEGQGLAPRAYWRKFVVLVRRGVADRFSAQSVRALPGVAHMEVRVDDLLAAQARSPP